MTFLFSVPVGLRSESARMDVQSVSGEDGTGHVQEFRAERV